ncbi:patatin-like phospholipase domain-containing protein 4 isoform X2 [Scyliorhinus torazame]|uniref:patatin-like phospholipase domain-containing protein 4 isoform X2 n=1 Tax=Scyliorhinus torazame TaxID=75743 RepID=UPI003B5BC405
MCSLNLTFSACGFLGIYHLGAAVALHRHGTTLLSKIQNYAGASGGALVAAVLLSHPEKLEQCKEFTYRFAADVRNQRLGAITPGYDFMKQLREGMESILSADAHKKAHTRLHVSITNAKTLKNSLISSYLTREDLITVLLASSFVPFYAGIKPVEYRGELSIANFVRLNQALFPPSQVTMESLYHKGFNDATRFLWNKSYFE